jgi:hypothetical protein
VKARKGLPNCVRAVGWAFFGAIVVMACLGCGGETENISTAQPVTEPAESGQTETLTTGHEGAAPDSSSGCSLPADFDTFPQEKQALEREWQAECEAAQAGYHAPKPTNQSPDLSCPLDLHVETGIAPLTFQPFPAGRNGVNFASVVSTAGIPYTVFAGAQDYDSQQGIIYVMQRSTDPCAEAAGKLTRFEGSFALPMKTGPVTLTAIEGDFVSFETPGGTKGKFRYATGEFIVQ